MVTWYKNFIIVCIVLFCSSAFAGMLINPFGTFGGGGDSYSDITLYWGCETTTAEKSAGDSSADIQFNAALSTDQYTQGAKSLKCTGEGYAQFDVSSEDIIDKDKGSIGFSFYVTTYATNAQPFQFQYDTSNRIYIAITATLIRLLWYGGGNAEVVEVARPSTSSWVHVEAKWDTAAGLGSSKTLQICLDGDSGTCASTTNSLTSLTNAPTILSLGNKAGVAPTYYQDQFMISNDPANRSLYDLRNTTDIN